MLQSTSLSERLAKVRELSNNSLTSSDLSPTPLWMFLYIYEQSKGVAYADYMHGAKALYKWLAPLEYPAVQAVEDNWKVPRLLQTYELQELSKIISGYKGADDLPALALAMRAITYSLTREVIPLTY